MIDPMVFGQRLRHYRKRQGLTLEQLGASIGRPAPFLSLVENGKREPKLSQIATLAETLGVSIAELLDPEPPSRRARLEVELERAQGHPRYRELGLPYLRPSARLTDDALEHIVTLFGRVEATPETTGTSELRAANAEVGRLLAAADGYLTEVEEAATQALVRCGYAGPGPLTGRHLNDLVASLGYRVQAIEDMPATARAVVDTERKRIYVAQRNELRTRQARKAVLQTVASMVLGHSPPRSLRELLTQRLETAYFAAAVLVPEQSAIPFIRAARNDRDLSVEDVKEQFYVSYEMAGQRFTNLATRHFGLPTHFVRSDADGTIWKAYANDGVPLPADGEGGSEGRRLCRRWGARTAFSSPDRFAIHDQFTDTPAGSFWCSTQIAADLSGQAFTVGVRFEDARLFRGRRTNAHQVSGCPDPSCCGVIDARATLVTSRIQSRLVSLLEGGLGVVEGAAVAEVLERHAVDQLPSTAPEDE
jgi:predicted transcriptional regulator/DNA-binding XRE family transcriptional regulator